MVLAIDIVKMLLPAGIMLVIAVLFALAIVILGKKLSIESNQKTEEIRKLLPGANCGACGYAGCDALAKALSEGKAKVSDCNVNSKKNKTELAHLLGSEEDGGIETVAVVTCNGGTDCENKYEYQGYGDCRTAEMLASGRKACPTGCIGLGSCVDACHYFAIEVNQKGVSKVNRDKCTSCGMCIQICPKKIIRRIPKSAKIYIACSNHCKGREVKDICKHGCIGCTLCEKACPEKAITMVDDLPVIDYSKCTGCYVCVDKCPVKCILKTGA